MSTKEQSAQQQLNESLSALMDGEASELELRRILKADTDEINEHWHRYQLASAALRGDVTLEKSVDLSFSISEAIADEPTYSSKKKTKTSVWSNIGRFAVAASVAGAVVVGVQFAPTGPATNIASTPTTPSAPVSGQLEIGGDTSVRVVDYNSQVPAETQQKPIIINEATQQQLKQMEGEVNRLMLEHAENNSQNTQQGVLPFVRVPDAEQ